MIILFILFVVQFSIACACLAVSDVQQHDLAQKGWYDANSDLRMEAQHIFACCGFSANRTQQELSTCAKVDFRVIRSKYWLMINTYLNILTECQLLCYETGLPVPAMWTKDSTGHILGTQYLWWHWHFLQFNRG